MGRPAFSAGARLRGRARFVLPHSILGPAEQHETVADKTLDRYGDAMTFQQAEIHAQRGEIDKAFAALEQALKIRDPGLKAIRVDPFLDPLRSNPRLAALERRLNLP